MSSKLEKLKYKIPRRYLKKIVIKKPLKIGIENSKSLYKDPAKGLDVSKPVKTYIANLKAYRQHLARVVKKIRYAYDKATANNKKTKKL